MSHRKDKLEELIRRIVSEMIITEIKDPRIGFVTVTSVELNRDFSEVVIGVSVLGTPREMRKSIEGLRSATGFIQHRLSKEVHIRHVPHVKIVLDGSVAEGVRMVELIDSLETSKDDPEEESSE